MTAGTGIDYKSVEVDGKTYKFFPLSPDKAIDFCSEAIISISPILTSVELGDGGVAAFIMRVIPNIGLIDPAKLKSMFAVVREQMILPNEKMAQDQLAFIEWFKANPSHLLEAHAKGLFVLVKDFFPHALGTILEGLNSKKS